jgi:3-deoxy-D-manno-octulosonic-acid transferase
LILTVAIHAANVHDGKAALDVIRELRGRFPRLSGIVAGGEDMEVNLQNGLKMPSLTV